VPEAAEADVIINSFNNSSAFKREPCLINMKTAQARNSEIYPVLQKQIGRISLTDQIPSPPETLSSKVTIFDETRNMQLDLSKEIFKTRQSMQTKSSSGVKLTALSNNSTLNDSYSS
jgi:hypothetical protein